MKNEIYNKLSGIDGIQGSIIADAGDLPPAAVPSPARALFVAALAALRASDEESIAILIGEKVGQRKLVACRWPKYHVVVDVIPGHPVNKSLQRILRRAGVRFGGLEVKSRRPRSQSCETEPPAASSDAPTPETSSASPEGATPPTGDSQEAR